MYKAGFYITLLFSFLFLLGVTTKLNAQNTPYFQNYSLTKYSAGNQNWDVSKSENGKLYIANNNGLLEYDGLKWSFFELPNQTTVRSVLATGDMIYTGSYEEFGYWKKNSKGVLEYHSLSQTIKNDITTNDEIWQIVSFKGLVVFRSFSSLYVYSADGKIKKIRPQSVVMSCDIVEDELYISTLRHGIYVLKNLQLERFFNDSRLENAKVVSINKYQNKLLITTTLDGSYFYENERLYKTDFKINQHIIQHQLNAFDILKDGRMVFGTIKDGLYVSDNKGEVVAHVNKANGLINNTVLRMFVEPNGKLWIGLDNGLVFMDLSSHNYFFNDVSGRLGAVYDVIDFRDRTYIGSNTGLFYLDSNKDLQFVEGSQGQVWDLEEIDGQLFCGHNDGTFLIEGNKLTNICPFTGGLTIKKVPEQNNLYVQGTYTGLVKYKKENENWKVNHLGGTSMLIRNLVFEDQYTAWVSHVYKGLYKVKFDASYDTILSVKSYKDKGIWSNFNVTVHKIKNDICFKSNGGWQKYEPLTDTILPYELLNQKLGKESYIISDFDSNQLVVKNKNESIDFVSLIGENKGLKLGNKYFQNRLVVGYERVSKLTDSLYALTLMDGFMLIDGNDYHENIQLQMPILERVEIDNQLVEITEDCGTIDVKFGKPVSLSLSSANSESYYLEYAITNIDAERWFKLESEKLELSSLNSGEYMLSIRAKNDFGEISSVKNIRLNVLPPWYRDTLGFALYAFLLLLTVVVLYILHKRKVEKEQRLLQLKFEKEQKELLKEKTLENDKKIVQLKNESLRNEIKLKSKQLANTAMALVKKNETLQELKQELVQHKDEFGNYFSYKKLIKKVDHSIDHKDEWEIFEYNFNQVHEEFFNQLKAKHPQLTHKDLKVCAYIKMNLSTKEIAPLMNISIRGVETHRYRLKRKLDLDNYNSLTEYLRNYN